MKLTVYDQKKKKMDDIELQDSIFNTEVNVTLLHQVIQSHLANARSGNASTKDSGEVSGSTRKLFKQKGTGNARPGSIKSPLQYGGGIVFGPHPRSYTQKINKKMYKSALRSALSDRVKSDNFFVVDSLKLSEPKTKNVSAILKSFNIKKCLLVDVDNRELTLSARNIYGVKTVKPEQVNPYDLIKYENVIVTKTALNKMNEFIA
ncbi:MAG: 50S ribosomal protein L4 [Proteobacteria bacterium]|nr:50S ribosomal protein L4 [Pseudomonadota bacterium]